MNDPLNRNRMLWFAIARVIVSLLLIWALARHPIGYYSMLRIVTTGVCAFGLYLATKSERIGWAFVFGGIVILFQPLVPFRIKRDTWQYLDIGTAVFLLASIPLLRKRSI